MKQSLAITSILSLAIGSIACTGAIGTNDGAPPGSSPDETTTPPGTTTSACTEGDIEAGPSPMRRMTRFEYDNTVRDLLGDTSKLARSFAPEEESLGFNNNADAMGVTGLLAEQFMDGAEKLAAVAITKLDAIAPACDVAKLGDDACAKQFIARFGKRAWRRPITEAETTKLLAVFAAGRKDATYASGIELVIQALLQSPHFLYRVEEGTGTPDDKGNVSVTSMEMASRLSYFLWGSMPDDALLAAGEAGKLSSPDEVANEARRLLKDPRAKEAIANFHAQWLELEKIETVAKNPEVYPDLTSAIAKDLRTETETFVANVFWNDGRVDELLTAPYTYGNANVAKWYGASPPSGSGFLKIALDPSQRAGILTQPGLLALHAKQNQTSPVHRGKFVRERLLCMTLPPPPNDIVIDPPDLDPKLSTRERFAEHSKNPACTGCHKLMDPIGFGFEHYDGVGKYRLKDGDFDVDANGEIFMSEDADGKFVGAVELAKKLAKSEQVKACVVTQWFRFAYGRGEGASDKCTLETLQKKFAVAKYDMRELLVALTQTSAFRYRKARLDGGGGS